MQRDDALAIETRRAETSGGLGAEHESASAEAERPKRLPWFPFYAADWLSDSDVIQMTSAERGVFIQLLVHSWHDGSLPADSARLARLTGDDPATFAVLWRAVAPRFVARDDGRLVNAKLEGIRSEQLALHEKRSEAGKRGMASRYRNGVSSAAITPLKRSYNIQKQTTETESDINNKQQGQTRAKNASVVVGLTPKDDGDQHRGRGDESQPAGDDVDLVWFQNEDGSLTSISKAKMITDLIAEGVTPETARKYVDRDIEEVEYQLGRLRDAKRTKSIRNPAGWIVKAIEGKWDVRG